ncbi:radical SAM family heme chaperone HemW [Roseateles sp.]|uniref:radical SAM family heme chaperone HemW n=1 Tax=Roseateles sp. TaxID=1971397 RepID=UPI003264EF11
MRPGTLQMPALPPLALYVHLPWCLRKCPYCDFNSHEVKEGALAVDTAEAYLAALRADLETALPLIWGRPVISIFIGGGTPSLFNPEQIGQLISDIRARLPLEAGCEITLEANPGTFERERFAGFRQAGVTRLSVGVQSFDDAQLKVLGRVHNATQARDALTEAAGAFETFNLDLMYALPGQTLDDLAREIDTALSFKPPHLSIYHLTIEPNTVFATRTPEHLPDADLASDMLDLITEKTGAVGLSRYEVSAYSREGHRCAHNLNYWQFGDYLGIGAGAHSKLSFPHRVLRQVRWREPAAFMAQENKVSNEHEVARKDLPLEFMLNALRLKDGVTVTQFLERTGLPPSSIATALETARGRGLLTTDAARIQPTERGFDFLSDLQQLFL